MNPDITFTTPFRTLLLRRWPRRRDERLRAWDGADRYLLEQVAEQPCAGPALVLNDTCGALALSLPEVAASLGDSWLAREAMRCNAADNDLVPATWAWPGDGLPLADFAVVRLPKDLSLLEYQLGRLGEALPAGAPVILGGMDKHLPANLLGLLTRYLDEPTAGLGRHKARLFFGRCRRDARPPEGWPAEVAVPGLPAAIHVHPGVFAGRQLDVGARFLLEHLPDDVSGNLVDLGCGNGVVGVAAALRNPDARVWFCDESAQAIRSAGDNAGRMLEPGRFTLHHGNGLDGLDVKFDLILLNPPFHRGHAVDEGVARMLFQHARRHLAPGGRLRVIGNRHLGYHLALPRLFPRVVTVAANARFVILDAFDNNKTSSP